MVQPLTIDIIQKHLDSDRRWRERRHPQWTLNYELYRDTVIINRLTQRQSVNVPYMKKTLKTYLTQTNWPVDNYYESKSNDKQAELFLNAYTRRGSKDLGKALSRRPWRCGGCGRVSGPIRGSLLPPGCS